MTNGMYGLVSFYILAGIATADAFLPPTSGPSRKVFALLFWPVVVLRM